MRPITPRPHVRAIAALLAACAADTAAVVAFAPAPGASPIIYPAALTDSFYALPGDLADHRPESSLVPIGSGRTEWSRQLRYQVTETELGRAALGWSRDFTVTLRRATVVQLS